MTPEQQQHIARLALDFYHAAQAAKATKADHTAAGFKFGDCKHHDPEDFDTIRCYRSGKPFSKWCKACRGKQPAWEHARTTRYAAIGKRRKLFSALASITTH